MLGVWKEKWRERIRKINGRVNVIKLYCIIECIYGSIILQRLCNIYNPIKNDDNLNRVSEEELEGCARAKSDSVSVLVNSINCIGIQPCMFIKVLPFYLWLLYRKDK